MLIADRVVYVFLSQSTKTPRFFDYAKRVLSTSFSASPEIPRNTQWWLFFNLLRLKYCLATYIMRQKGQWHRRWRSRHQHRRHQIPESSPLPSLVFTSKEKQLDAVRQWRQERPKEEEEIPRFHLDAHNHRRRLPSHLGIPITYIRNEQSNRESYHDHSAWGKCPPKTTETTDNHSMPCMHTDSTKIIIHEWM